MKRGLILALLQTALVLGLIGLYLFDRWRLPQVWTAARPLDFQTALHGRYLQLKLRVSLKNPDNVTGSWTRCRIAAEKGTLTAYADVNGDSSTTRTGNEWLLDKPLNFFIGDPSTFRSRNTLEYLWAQVTVPRRGDPRPLRVMTSQSPPAPLAPLAAPPPARRAALFQ